MLYIFGPNIEPPFSIRRIPCVLLGLQQIGLLLNCTNKFSKQIRNCKKKKESLHTWTVFHQKSSNCVWLDGQCWKNQKLIRIWSKKKRTQNQLLQKTLIYYLDQTREHVHRTSELKKDTNAQWASTTLPTASLGMHCILDQTTL